MDEPSFSINDFRKWLSTQSKQKSIATDILECRLGLLRLTKEILTYNPAARDIDRLASSIKESGAPMVGADGNNYIVSCLGQNLSLPKTFFKAA